MGILIKALMYRLGCILLSVIGYVIFNIPAKVIIPILIWEAITHNTWFILNDKLFDKLKKRRSKWHEN